MTQRKKHKKLLALLLALAISLSVMSAALAAETEQTDSLASMNNGAINYLADEDIAPGIHYTEQDVLNFQETGRRTRINHLVIDPSVGSLRIITSKAGDTVNALESVETQANREIAKGNNVIATINADTFDMYTSNGGIPTGLMIQNGAIITSQPNDFYNCCNVPCFYTETDGSFDIAHLMVQGNITVGTGFQKDVNLINRTNFYNRFAGVARSYETCRIYTSAVNKTHTMCLNSPDSAVADSQLPVSEAYALIQVDNFTGSIYPNISYTGMVTQVYTNQGFTIPDNCIVLAGFNDDSDSVASLQAGDAVTYFCNVYTGEWSGGYNSETNMAEDKAQPVGELTELTNVFTAVSAFHNLAVNGVSIVDPNYGYDEKNARTLLGITEDGKLQVVTINESGMMDVSLTDGATFQEMVAYMLDTLGCKDVINLDSGGSAEMAVRRAGSNVVTQASYPSDGGSRSVTNALLFISDAERTAEVGSVIVDSDANIYLGSGNKFSVRLTDTNGNALDLGDHHVAWSAEKGTIDDNGNYTAPSEVCTDTVTATVDGTYIGTATVNIVDDSVISTIALSPSGSLALDKGDVLRFSILAYNSDMQQIVIGNDKVEWSVSDGIGTIDNGLLTVTADEATGSVTALIFGNTLTTDLIIGIKEQVIENFESTPIEGFSAQRTNDSSTYYYGGAAGASDWILLNDDETGDHSLKVNYIMNTANSNLNIRFRYNEDSDRAGNGVWSEETRAAMDTVYLAKAMPKKLGMMVYGDNSGNRLYAGVVMGYGTPNAQNMSSLGGITINWSGWKWVEISIPQTYLMPIHLRYLWIQRTNNSGAPSTLCFDDIKFLYTDNGADLSGPEFSGVSPAAGNVYSDTLNFSATVKDAKSAVDPDSIEVQVNGDPVNDFAYEPASGKLSFSRNNLQDGQDYTVTVSASDVLENTANPSLSVTYHIDTAPDNEAPVISRVTPRQSIYPIQILRPRINFRLQDDKNTVDASSVKVMLNEENLPVYFDAETGYAYAQPDFDLFAGTSTFTIAASDIVGNAMTPYNGSFTVDPIEQPADPNNYTVTVIPDTQGNAFSNSIYGRAANDTSNFVIQMGDIVDVKDQSDYDAAVADISLLNGKPAFVIGGNHEGLNTEAYYDTFNSPTYYFEYGNALYIVLNSMLGQSVTYSDSTQYHWLEEVLAENTRPNVYVLNHVVTRDDYQTSHNMTDAEADMFEGIMSDYKTAHPGYTVTVLFGHMHTLHNWQVGGVNYIVTGNGASKAYVTHDQGDILGTGTITMREGKTSFGFDPLLTKVYIQNSALYGEKINTVLGAELQLDLYGDFREYPANYLTQINDDSLINITWSSSDSSVASVDSKGAVRILNEGTAEISATCGGKTAGINMVVQALDDTKLVKLSLSLPDKITVGSDFIPTLTSTDVNGNKVLLDNTKARFLSQNGFIVSVGNGKLNAAAAGIDTVTAQYELANGKTLNATATVSIEAINMPVNSGGGTPAAGDTATDSGSAIIITNGGITTVADTVKGTTTSDGVAAANVTNAQIADMKEKAVSEAREQSTQAAIEFDVDTDDSAKGISLTVPQAAAEALTDGSIDALTVSSSVAMVTFDKTALDEIGKQMVGDITITVTIADTGVLSDENKLAIGDRPVYDFTVTSGSKAISSFGGGSASISLPYTPVPGEDPNAIVVYYISNSGELQTVRGKYDPAAGTVRFTTTHFSRYAVGYNKVAFSDVVSTDWYYNPVTFIAARGITTGSTASTFSPDNTLTRGQFVVMLMRAYGIAPNESPTDNFSDAGNTYYTGYLAAARRLGISNGTGNNNFAPDSCISRQDMFTLLYRALGILGELPEAAGSKTTSDFGDAGLISSYAQEAMNALVQSGIISGSGGKLNPTGTTIRAEMAQVLYNLLSA